MVKVKYVGDGSSMIPGVPNVDHECSEEEAYQRVSSGLFEFTDTRLKSEMTTLIEESVPLGHPDAEIDEEATAKMQIVEKKEPKD